jgi:methyl-accepting chemotaxis protein WspA
MTNVMGRFKIKYRLWIIVAIALASLVVTDLIFLFTLKSELLEEKKITTKSAVETAYGVVEYFQKNAKGGGMPRSDAQQYAKEITKRLRYADNEYFWINDMVPVFISHPYPEMDQKDVSDLKDPSGRKMIVEMVERVKAGGAGYVNYLWNREGSGAPVPKISYVKGFEPWGWVVGSGIYVDDVDKVFRTKAFKLGMIMLFLTFIIVGLSLVIARSITNPLAVVKEGIQHVAEGDLRVKGNEEESRLRAEGTDEMADLLRALHHMRKSLDSLVGQVQLSGIQVTSSTTEIAASARELEATVAEQAASIREVTATTKDISSTSDELMQTMVGVSETASQTAGMGEEGRAKLGHMQASMGEFITATNYISSKLGVINEKANKISGIVTTINKISDQTNLLSLNAAIEAEKAGEYGKGFSVVAREITRLSDQTAIATKDIEYMVKEMQSSVSSGVMEMDKFAESVRRGVDEVATIGNQLAAIIDRVRKLGPQFETVTRGMHMQVEGAQQISEAMSQLSTAAEQTKDSLSEYKRVTEQLNAAVQALQNEVSRFKLDRG